jgi:predicted Fe-Mo cluster-binding NifX family protein
MKVAVTVFKNGVSPRVDIADTLLIYDIENGVIREKEKCSLNFDHPAQLISVLQKKEIATVICGGCSQFFSRMLFFNGFDVMPGLIGDPEHIIKNLIDGKLNHISLETCAPFGRKHRRRNQFHRGKNK